jgi:hypothetical protein
VRSPPGGRFANGEGGVVRRLGPLIPGREEAAREVLGEAVQYLHRLKQVGKIDSFDAVALEPHGGDLSGFFQAGNLNAS